MNQLNENGAWQEFFKTGKIEHYLTYRNSQNPVQDIEEDNKIAVCGDEPNGLFKG